ncbi:unnamed protein product, partial [Pylaiella littoralis]
HAPIAVVGYVLLSLDRCFHGCDRRSDEPSVQFHQPKGLLLIRKSSVARIVGGWSFSTHPMPWKHPLQAPLV